MFNGVARSRAHLRMRTRPTRALVVWRSLCYQQSRFDLREAFDMNRRFSILACAIGVAAAAVPLRAHHSFSAEFDASKPVTLHGKLTRMEWVNPHGWIYIDAVGPDGVMGNWAIEAGAPNALLRRGLRKTDFPAGVEIVVTGYLAKNGGRPANGSTVSFMDGREFFMGSSNTGAPSDKP
jgi:hypothetical protein